MVLVFERRWATMCPTRASGVTKERTWGLRRCVVIAGLLLGFWLAVTPPAHAYIDPGSTNFLLQIIAGSLLGAGLAIATFWKRIKSFLGRLFSRTER